MCHPIQGACRVFLMLVFTQFRRFISFKTWLQLMGANLMIVTSLRLLLFFVDSVILHSPFRQRTDTWLAPIAFGGI